MRLAVVSARLAVVAAASLAFNAVAQTADEIEDNRTATVDRETLTPPDRLLRLRAFLRERAQTRPRNTPPPIGRPPLGNVSAEVEWGEVQQLLAETSRSDSAATTSVAAFRPARREGLRALAPGRLQTVSPPEVERVRMPVLVPGSEAVLATVQVFGQPEAYSAIATAAVGIDLRISGSRRTLLLEAPSAPRLQMQRMRDSRPPLPGIKARYVITRSESSTDLSFSRFGCGYVISLMCDDPETDARCAKDDFIIELASSMALLNENAGEDQ